MVFDIDETALSNLEFLYKTNFEDDYDLRIEWFKEAKAKPIKF